jgi:8-oxo-dGTP pyrophosphatase MutT (NUDIX family)
VLVPFVFIDGDEYLLFEKRASGIRQGGEICFPGGALEHGEKPEHAALRETVEELGISPDSVVIERHFGYLLARIGAVIDVYVGRLTVDSVSRFVPNKDEVETLHLIPVSFFAHTQPKEYPLETIVHSTRYNEHGEKEILFPAKELGIPEMYHDSWRVRDSNVYVYTYNDIVIWGLTAEIVREIAKTLGEKKSLSRRLRG